MPANLTGCQGDSKHMKKLIDRLKHSIQAEYQKQHEENALKLTSICADILYEYNQYYMDPELEQILSSISEHLFQTAEPLPAVEEGTILFYDGFGLDSRGLAHIYLKALCRSFHVIYMTKKSRKACIPGLMDFIKEHQAQAVFFDDHASLLSQINEVHQRIQSCRPAHMLLYTTPSDVVIPTVSLHYAGQLKRYQVNLTDHAFWLGARSFDYCIEFRDYGASISSHDRGIPEEKLLKLPFYPVIDPDQPFQGFPFEFDAETQKLIFSGGALYKTIGDHNKYYQIVEHILNTYPEAIFWYAGRGNRTFMDQLIEQYPGRVYLTDERPDLFQILKRAYLYLNTYPMVGGLMTQYAACAGRLPLTLKFDSISDEFLIQQEDLRIEFQTMKELYAEIDHLFTNDGYWQERCQNIRNAVITEEQFHRQLVQIIQTGSTSYPIKISQPDTKAFRKSYLERLDQKGLQLKLADRHYPVLLRYFPQPYISGMLKKLGIKLKLCFHHRR